MSTDLESAIPDVAVEDEFLDLVLADDDLLRAEFDAIIAAGFDAAEPPRGRPPGREGRPSGEDGAGWPNPDERDHRDEDARLRLTPWCDHLGVWSMGRQRSPPSLRRV